MSKHNRSFFSDSSDDDMHALSPPRSAEKASKHLHSNYQPLDLSNVQKFNCIEVGERCLEIIVEIISMAQNREGQNQITVTALVSGLLETVYNR